MNIVDGIRFLHHRAAGNVEHLAGDIAGDIRRQENGGVGDISSGGHPAQGEGAEHGRPHLLHLLRRELGRVFPENGTEISGSRAGSNTVDADAGFSFHEGQLPGEEINGVLGHGIHPDAHGVLVGAAGADIDDDAILLRPHGRYDGLCDVHRADEVEFQLFFPDSGVLLIDGYSVLVDDTAGDVAEDVNFAEFIEDLLDHGVDHGAIPDIRLQSHRPFYGHRPG
jgi:hypothetical protein